VSTQRRSRAGRSEVASRSLIARIPVSGVRTSWANTASAASTTPDEALDLRVLPAAERFFAGRFLGARFERTERDLAAMIFGPLALLPWHGEALGVTGAFRRESAFPEIRSINLLEKPDQPADVGRACAAGTQLAQAR